MKQHWQIFFLLIILEAFMMPSAIAQDERHYTCYRAEGPILADGLLNEPSWSMADWSDYFIDITGDPKLKPPLRTRVKMLWDDDCLYVAAELCEPDVWATIRQRDAVIFQDNDFEIFLDPDGNGLNYYEIEINAFGTIWDLLLTKPYRDHGTPVNSWDLKGLKSGVRINGSINDPSKTDSSWVVEMALPLAELMQGKNPGKKPADGVQWRINFSRVEWKTKVSGTSYEKLNDSLSGNLLPEQNWVWSPMKVISMHLPERWGRLEFSSEKINPQPLTFKNAIQEKEFRIWLWMGGNSSWESRQWDSLFSRFKTAGITGILTQADPATLEKVIPPAIKYGITVEKWFVAMMNNNPALIRDHPGWFVVNRKGRSSVTDPAYVGYYRFLCPSNPEVREYLKARIEEYLKIPGLGGIHLDYIRYPDVILPKGLWSHYGIIQDKEYPQYDYCYCDLCREKFREKTGIDPMPMEHPDSNAAWRQFRYDQVTSLVKDLKLHCGRSGMKLSAAVFPGPDIARELVRQDWDHWTLDEVFPMLYQNFYYGTLDWIRLETSEGVSSLYGSAPLYSGLFIPALTPREMQTAIRKSMEGGASGVCLFNFESMMSGHWEVLRKVFGFEKP